MKKSCIGLLMSVLGSAAFAQEPPRGTAGPLRPRPATEGPRATALRTEATISALNLSGCGVARIDGVIDPAEWSGAAQQSLTVNVPGGTAPATLYVMNDNLNLYLALRIQQSAVAGNSLAFEFDNDNDGIAEDGDDAVVHNPAVRFFDDYRTTCPGGSTPAQCAPEDTSGGGSTDGQGAFANDGTYTTYEIAHPLASGDAGHDFSVAPGTTLGFFLSLRFIDAGGSIADTDYPGFRDYGQITINSCLPSVLSACGLAAIDGVLSPGEWSSAAAHRLSVRVPGGSSTPATLYVMNDSVNLYMALEFDRAIVDPGNSFVAEFDNDNDGTAENGDDAYVYNPPIGLVDDFRTNVPPCPPGSAPATCGLRDVDDGGTNDGSGAFLNSGGRTVYETSHPLSSGDAGHDFALLAGDTVGFFIFNRMIGPGGVFPTDFGDTTWPGFRQYASLEICSNGAASLVAALSSRLEALSAAGLLSDRDRTHLLRILDAALRAAEAGRRRRAIADLERFIDVVERLAGRDRLPLVNARELQAAARSVISQL
jgi:FIMAH domain-containing protein